jgi:hypothetical protein
MMFPNQILQKTEASNFSALTIANYKGILENDLSTPNDFHSRLFGYFGYLFLISLLYIILAKERRALIPISWFLFAFAYLGFGSQTLTQYIPVLVQDRFMIIFCPAIALVISCAMVNFAGRFKGPRSKYVAYAILGIALLALSISSVSIIRYTDISQYYFTEPMIQVSDFISSLPGNAIILTYNDLPWEAYSNYQHNVSDVYPTIQGTTTCSELNAMPKPTVNSGYYIVDNYDSNLSGCGMDIVYRTSVPSWLDNYTLFNGQANFWGAAVYRYNET